MKTIFLITMIFITPMTYCMEPSIPSVDSLKLEEVNTRKRDIFFKTVATIIVGTENNLFKFLEENDLDLPHFRHPLIEHNEQPYKNGNGGLLNPVLKKYNEKKDLVEGENYKGVQIEVSGHVAADGIAAYEFDNIYMGEHYCKTTKYKGEICQKGNYEMSKLEEAILGYLKERSVDRIKSDFTDKSFLIAETPFADEFRECIKHEWTSKQKNEDTGLRTEQEDKLIQRHMARSTYWPSRWHKPENMRSGEHFRKESLKGEKDKFASIELNEFEVDVKIPGHDDSNCSIM